MDQLGFQEYHSEPHESAKWVISGPDCQILTVSLKPGEMFECEPGSMMYMSHQTNTTTDCNPNCSRFCAGESCCKLKFKNDNNKDGYLGVTPKFPAKIIPVSLPSVNKRLIAKRGAYMSAMGNADITCDLNCTSAGCCGGLGICRQNIRGDGVVFLAAGGTILTKKLKEGEKIRIDTDAIVGYEESLKFGINFSGNLCAMCFGGEGCFNTSVEGPGLVILQSMSFEKFQAAVAPPPQGGDGVAEVAVNAATQ